MLIIITNILSNVGFHTDLFSDFFFSPKLTNDFFNVALTSLFVFPELFMW